MKKINNQRDYNVGDCCPPLVLLSYSWWVFVEPSDKQEGAYQFVH